MCAWPNGQNGCSSRRPISAAAFSLVELVLVLAIVAVISAMAIPRFSSSIARHRVDAAAQLIQADIALARRRAMATSIVQGIAFETVGKTAVLRLVGLADRDHPGQEYAHDLFEEPYSLTAISVDFGGLKTVKFDMYGVPSSGGALKISVGAEARKITLDPDTGETSVEE